MNKNLCIIYDEFFLKHKAEFSHAERPERLTSIIDFLKLNPLIPVVDFIKPLPANRDQIISVHSAEHYNFVKTSVENRKEMLDPDTYINENSLEAALIAAGSTIKAVDLVLSTGYKSAFCLVRPPGHHAESSRPMGFCLFNNIAVGAKYALTEYSKKRIAIIDWDVHHGNGTQDIFYSSDEVLFISIHQHPLYPGTGNQFESGAGKGEGYTINYPLPPGTAGSLYIKILEEVLGKLEKYNPEIIFISAGFDAHIDDPLANMNLSSADFGSLTRLVKQFADSFNIPIISVLEGGYNLQALSESVYEHLNVLNNNEIL